MNRIALVIPTVDRIGGAERQLILLAKGLARRNWQVTVIALSGTGECAASELSDAGVEFLSLGMRKGLADPRGWIRFNRWITHNRPHVVHAHLPHAAMLMRCSRLGAPFHVAIDTMHTPATAPWLRQLGYFLSNWLPDKVTAVSEGTADACLSARMVSRSRLTLLPNGVDVDIFRPDPAVRIAMRRELSLTDEFLWIAAGRLDPVKNYPALLNALSRITQPVRLVVAGTGPLEASLRQLSAHLGLNGKVQFLGFEPNVLRWMQSADAFVLSSRWEGLSMSLLEASACALPSVATDVAGNREIIVDGSTGLLATAASQVALAEAMNRLMQMSSGERRTMGDRAQQLIAERFSLDRILDRWEELYAELLAQNSRPSRWAPARSALTV